MSMLFLSLVYFVYIAFKQKPVASCSDGILNQGEEDIDCGGPCPPCELKNLQPIKIYPAIVVNYEKTSDLVGFIENPNKNLALEDLKYYFEIYDLRKNLIDKTEVRSTILPPSTKLVLTFIDYPRVKDIGYVNLALIVPKSTDWKRLELPPLPVVFYNEKLNLERNSWKLSATLFNKGFLPYKIEVIVFIYNQDKRLINVSKSLVTINSQETKDLVLTFPYTKDLPAGFEIYLQRTDLQR